MKALCFNDSDNDYTTVHEHKHDEPIIDRSKYIGGHYYSEPDNVTPGNI